MLDHINRTPCISVFFCDFRLGESNNVTGLKNEHVHQSSAVSDDSELDCCERPDDVLEIIPSNSFAGLRVTGKTGDDQRCGAPPRGSFSATSKKTTIEGLVEMVSGQRTRCPCVYRYASVITSPSPSSSPLTVCVCVSLRPTTYVCVRLVEERCERCGRQCSESVGQPRRDVLTEKSGTSGQKTDGNRVNARISLTDHFFLFIVRVARFALLLM